MSVDLSRQKGPAKELINFKKNLINSDERISKQKLRVEKGIWSNEIGFKIGLPAIRDEILDDPFIGILLKYLKEKELTDILAILPANKPGTPVLTGSRANIHRP